LIDDARLKIASTDKARSASTMRTGGRSLQRVQWKRCQWKTASYPVLEDRWRTYYYTKLFGKYRC